MYEPTTTGAATSLSGAAGITLLPNTGGYRFMFVLAAITLGIGLLTLAVSFGLILRKKLSKV